MMEKVFWHSIFRRVFIFSIFCFTFSLGAKKNQQKKILKKRCSLKSIKRKIIKNRYKNKKNNLYNRLTEKQKKFKIEQENFAKEQIIKKEKLLKIIDFLNKKNQFLEEKEKQMKQNNLMNSDFNIFFHDEEWNILKTYLQEK